MYAYRVDKRPLSKGDVIFPTGEWYQDISNNLDKHTIESILDNNRASDLLARKDALFLFASFDDAIVFSSKMNESYIYLVEVKNTQDSKYCRVDMDCTELMKIFKSEQNTIAKNYWEGRSYSTKPCYEYMVNQAKVIEKICDFKKAKDLREKRGSSNLEYFKGIYELLSPMFGFILHSAPKASDTFLSYYRDEE